MFTIHPDGFAAGDVFGMPPSTPALEDPPPDAQLSDDAAWWRDHVAQFRSWVSDRYRVELDRRAVLVLLGVGHPTINTVQLSGAEYMLGTPAGVENVDDGEPSSYRFGLIRPGVRQELPVLWRGAR